jgi:hypothetical protein
MKMKTLFTILTLVSISATTFAQGGDYDELMSKSRKARTTSTIFVAAGPVIAAGGVGTLIYGLLAKEIDNGNSLYDTNGNFIGYGTKSYTTEIVVGAAGAAVGIALALTSIHFSRKASDLKREARKTKLKTSFDRLTIPGLQNGMAGNQARQFKFSLMVPLGSH